MSESERQTLDLTLTGLDTRWNSSASATSFAMRANGHANYPPIFVVDEKTTKRHHVRSMEVAFRRRGEGSPVGSLFVNIRHLRGNPLSDLQPPTGIVTIDVPVDVWAALAAASNELHHRLMLSFRAVSASVPADRDFVTTPLHDILLYLTRSVSGAARRTTVPAEDLFAAVQHEILEPDNAHDSMQYRIGRELALSYTQWLGDKALTKSYREDACRELGEFMRNIRKIFHERVACPGTQGDDVFCYSPKDFTEALAKFPESEQSILRESYNRVWQHVPMTKLLGTGVLKTDLCKYRHRWNVEALEELARQYRDSKFASPQLEWALIDALMFAAVLSFADAGIPVFGMPMIGRFKRTTWAVVSAVLAEGFKLLVTYGIAAFFSRDDKNIFWMIFLVITAARYVAMGIGGKGRKLKNRELLKALGTTHDQLTHYHFNSKQLRRVLYALVTRGVVLSPWILTLLDKRIARERAPNGS